MIHDGPLGAASRPTRARHVVTGFALLIAIIMYLDRVCIAQAAPAISHDLGLSLVQMGWAFAAFNWAYALFEVPGGWLGDRIGPRRVLTRVVLWWSFFTAATGWVWNATVAHRDARAVRRRRGRLLSQPDAHLHDLASGARARARAGDALVRGAVERRVHAAARRLRPRIR